MVEICHHVDDEFCESFRPLAVEVRADLLKQQVGFDFHLAELFGERRGGCGGLGGGGRHKLLLFSFRL
jgi:hypothetical protein